MEHGEEVKYRNRIKVLIDKLRDEAGQELAFSDALFNEGDKINSQYRDGLAHGILKAVKEIKTII